MGAVAGRVIAQGLKPLIILALYGTNEFVP